MQGREAQLPAALVMIRAPRRARQADDALRAAPRHARQVDDALRGAPRRARQADDGFALRAAPRRKRHDFAPRRHRAMPEALERAAPRRVHS